MSSARDLTDAVQSTQKDEQGFNNLNIESGINHLQSIRNKYSNSVDGQSDRDRNITNNNTNRSNYSHYADSDYDHHLKDQLNIDSNFKVSRNKDVNIPQSGSGKISSRNSHCNSSQNSGRNSINNTNDSILRENSSNINQNLNLDMKDKHNKSSENDDIFSIDQSKIEYNKKYTNDSLFSDYEINHKNNKNNS